MHFPLFYELYVPFLLLNTLFLVTLEFSHNAVTSRPAYIAKSFKFSPSL